MNRRPDRNWGCLAILAVVALFWIAVVLTIIYITKL